MHSHYAWRPRFNSEPLFNPFARSPDRNPHPEEMQVEVSHESTETDSKAEQIEPGPAKPPA